MICECMGGCEREKNTLAFKMVLYIFNFVAAYKKLCTNHDNNKQEGMMMDVYCVVLKFLCHTLRVCYEMKDKRSW